jgi:hypothetical protein
MQRALFWMNSNVLYLRLKQTRQYVLYLRLKQIRYPVLYLRLKQIRQVCSDRSNGEMSADKTKTVWVEPAYSNIQSRSLIFRFPLSKCWNYAVVLLSKQFSLFLLLLKQLKLYFQIHYTFRSCDIPHARLLLLRGMRTCSLVFRSWSCNIYNFFL